MDIALTVTPGSGPTAAGSLLRSEQAYLELLSEKTTLDGGIAFYSHRFPTLRRQQQFREVWIESAEQARIALASAEDLFRELGLICASWTLAESQDPGVVEPVLRDAGFQRRDRTVMALASWPQDASPTHALRVLPARPMRAAFLDIWQEAGAVLPEHERAALVEAGEERLDDHRMDAFVAMDGKVCAGMAALFQVGDIGRVVDVFVRSDMRRRGVATTLLNHLVAMAKRLMLRVVCIDLDAEDVAGRALLERMNFVSAGTVVEFVAPSEGAA